MTRLADTLNGLAAMSPAALRAKWRRLYRAPALALSSDLLVRGVAYRLQDKACGGLAPAAERELVRLAARGTPPTGSSTSAVVSLRSGTRLVRSGNGETNSLLVTEDGYRFNDQTYSSLSTIAKVITGTKWSGPRFFGLKGSATAKGARHA